MNRRATLTVGSVAAILLVVILAEWIVGATRLSRTGAPVAAHAAVASRSVAAADIAAPQATIDGWLRTALARPLMTAIRAPVAASGPTLSLSSGLPRLAGTLTVAQGGGSAAVAIFARDDGGHPVVVREGGSLGPYRVTRIAPNSVTLDGPAGRQVLHERFGTHSAADTPAPPLTMPGIMQPNFPGLVPPQMRDPNPLLQMQQQQQQQQQQAVQP